MKALELEGRRSGRLEVIERTTIYRSGHAMWLCKCDCGNFCYASGTNLYRNRTRSCGCLLNDAIRAACVTHDMSSERLYSVWAGMMRRCENTSFTSFENYGGRGIKVCKERHDFMTFYAWAKPLYSAGLQLDRIDNDGDYEPGNCRFVTPSINACNKRKRSSELNYTGVVRNRKLFSARVNYENTKYHLGSFSTIKEAVMARNEFIVKNNFPHKLQEVPEL